MAKLLPPEGRYFNYLCALVQVESLPGHTFFSLCRELYRQRFMVRVKRDNNRERDGYALRKRFAEDTGIRIWELVPDYCSFFEFLIALAYRMNDEVYDEEKKYTPSYWFYELLSNLGLIEYEDDSYDQTARIQTLKAVYIVNNRKYEYDGTYGLFPLDHPKGDQRRLEIAKQMSQYLFEHYKHI